jgi:hypothetical protein
MLGGSQILPLSIDCVLETTGFCLRLKGKLSSSIRFGIVVKRTDEWRFMNTITLHAQIIKKNGKKEYAVLPYKEFLKLQEEIEDYTDLRCLRRAKEAEKDAPTIGMAELKKRLTRRSSRRR